MCIAGGGREKGGLEAGWIVVFLEEGLAVEAGGGYGRRGCGGGGGGGVADALASRTEDTKSGGGD